MATFHSVVKQIVLQNIDLSEQEGQTLRQVWDSEYGYNKLTPQSCTDYLRGLPSVCTIPFNNFEILELLKAAGFDKVTEKGRYGLVDKYWKEAGNQFYHLIK